ncbi:MAG: hypothetical protein ACYC77_06520 [Coriobacteriia bacterium]
MRRATATLISIAIALALLGGCSRAADTAPARTVRSYVAALPSALNAESLDALRLAATEAQTERVRLFVMQSVGLGERMEARLAKFEVEESDVAADGVHATVAAVEEWDILYRDAETATELRRERYRSRVRYAVVLVEGRWLVDSVEEERLDE